MKIFPPIPSRRLIALASLTLLLAVTVTAQTNPPASLFAAPPSEAWKVELLKKPIHSFCIDFNWQIKSNSHKFATPGHWADVDPAAQVAWCKAAGVNCIQTFVLSCNGYAWYKNGPVPEQPGLKTDYLTDMVRLGHQEHMLVMGYYCVSANTLWGRRHPEMSYGAPATGSHIPLTRDYIDYLCLSITDALKKTGMDGFMLDWFRNTSGKWLDCEKTMYVELMGTPFPGADKITAADKAEFDRRAVERCWLRIRDTARKVKPDCILWPNGVEHLDFEGVDWLLNESPNLSALEKARAKLDGRPIRLIQNEVGWPNHDARRVFADPQYKTADFYGYAAPYDDALPLPVAEYLGRPIESFTGKGRMQVNDRNLAALVRFYLGQPVAPAPAPAAAAATNKITQP